MEGTKKELKPRSFRLSDDTCEKLKELTKELSGNQEEVLAQLIQTFEMEKGKNLLPDRKKEITDFQNYTEMLTKMFMHSLEDYAVLEEKILLQYEDKLRSKDETIVDLQGKVTELKQIKEQAVTTAKTKTDENSILTKELEEIKADFTDKLRRVESNLQDKEGLVEELKESKNKANEQIASLTMELSKARTQLGEVDNLKKNVANITKKLEEAKQQISNMEKEKVNIETAHKNEISLVKEKAAMAEKNYKKEAEFATKRVEMEKEKALMEQAKVLKEEADKMEQKYKADVEKYQKKYEEMLDKWENSKS